MKLKVFLLCSALFLSSAMDIHAETNSPPEPGKSWYMLLILRTPYKGFVKYFGPTKSRESCVNFGDKVKKALESYYEQIIIFCLPESVEPE